jgi:putative phosphoesterase
LVIYRHQQVNITSTLKIGLLSDTHSYLDPKVLEHFRNCDEIWHAGDIGDAAVIEQLQKSKPVKAVFGNIDTRELQSAWPEDISLEVEGVRVLMTHIGGTPPHYNPRVRKLIELEQPRLFICGHSHILKIGRDAEHGNLLFVNPGAAGNHGFHVMKTVVRFEILTGEVRNMEVIELGRRGAL